MIDLNNIGSGRKLIKEVMNSGNNPNTTFSKTKQVQQSKKQKNPHNRQSRLRK